MRNYKDLLWVIKESVTSQGAYDVCSSGDIFNIIARSLSLIDAEQIVMYHNQSIDKAWQGQSVINFRKIDEDDVSDFTDGSQWLFINNAEELMMPAIVINPMGRLFVVTLDKQFVPVDDIFNKYKYYAKMPEITL